MNDKTDMRSACVSHQSKGVLCMSKSVIFSFLKHVVWSFHCVHAVYFFVIGFRGTQPLFVISRVQFASKPDVCASACEHDMNKPNSLSFG